MDRLAAFRRALRDLARELLDLVEELVVDPTLIFLVIEYFRLLRRTIFLFEPELDEEDDDVVDSVVDSVVVLVLDSVLVLLSAALTWATYKTNERTKRTRDNFMLDVSIEN